MLQETRQRRRGADRDGRACCSPMRALPLARARRRRAGAALHCWPRLEESPSRARSLGGCFFATTLRARCQGRRRASPERVFKDEGELVGCCLARALPG